jgi:Cu+-exporting ATPase
VLVRVDDQPRAVLAVGDTVKPGARTAVEDLRRLGLRTLLLTGDNEAAGRSVADQLGIDEVVAGVLPQDKSSVVAALQESGAVVAMVGDGVNDAAALVQADLGIAMGTGTDAAIEAGNLTLVNGDPGLVGTAVRLARRTLRTIRQNLFWAFAYNLVGIPIAALGLLDPMIAGAAMAASSVCVVSNSLRLRAFRPEG